MVLRHKSSFIFHASINLEKLPSNLLFRLLFQNHKVSFPREQSDHYFRVLFCRTRTISLRRQTEKRRRRFIGCTRLDPTSLPTIYFPAIHTRPDLTNRPSTDFLLSFLRWGICREIHPCRRDQVVLCLREGSGICVMCQCSRYWVKWIWVEK